jgi:RNA polymerase sigma-70 factor (ECF subfamily)
MLVVGVHPVWSEIEVIYRSRRLAFVRVARAITGERESALEAVQEGFADALRHADGWNRRGTLEAWVWRCVVNRARKARPRRHELALPPLNEEPWASPDDADLRDRIAALPERQRLVVFLRYFADLDYQGVAEVLDVRVGTVAATLHAAHAALRAAFQEVAR